MKHQSADITHTDNTHDDGEDIEGWVDIEQHFDIGQNAEPSLPAQEDESDHNLSSTLFRLAFGVCIFILLILFFVGVGLVIAGDESDLVEDLVEDGILFFACAGILCFILLLLYYYRRNSCPIIRREDAADQDER